MSDGQDIVVQALVETASRHGFHGVRSKNFYREWPETICVVNLQKSSWGPQFYINAAVWFTRLGSERRPKEHNCHIIWRVDSLMASEQSKAFEEALNLDHSIPDDRRFSLIKEGIETCGFGLLARCESEEAALQIAGENGSNMRVALKARTQEKVN